MLNPPGWNNFGGFRPILKSRRNVRALGGCRQRELRSAPHVRYWPAVSVRHGTFRPVHVDGVLCWLWQPHQKPGAHAPEPSAARINAMSTAHFDEHERLSARDTL
jgi:hypothetical protein